MDVSSSSYPAAWQTYRRRRNAFIGAVASYAGLLGLVALFPRGNLFAAYWWAAAPPLFVWFVVTGFRLTYWRCPSCGKAFFARLLVGNLFARRCLHCGLRKWGDLESGGRGA